MIFVTAGSSYLDIDAYACMVSMAELLNLQRFNAIAYSAAPCNYSVCDSLMKDGHISCVRPHGVSLDMADYIIVDVSDPGFLRDSIPLDNIIRIYDHHAGFEEYWKGRIGTGAHIEFIGAAATLIYREWKIVGLENKMKRTTALLLVAAILDNTLNLTSSNTTEEDRSAFLELCAYARIGDDFRKTYFSEVQQNVEKDLKTALLGDIKTVSDNPVLPHQIAQLCVWDAGRILTRLSEIRNWFTSESWMINIIDLSKNCGYFVCDDEDYQQRIARVFNIRFVAGVACTANPYLRKQILKKTFNIV